MRINNSKKVNKRLLLLYFMIEWVVIALIEIYGVIPIYYPEMRYSFSAETLPIPLLALCIYAILAPVELEKPSTWAFLLLVLALGIPSTVIYWVFKKEIHYLLIMLLFMLVLALTIRLRVQMGIPKFINTESFLNILFFAYVAASLFLFVKRGGIDSRAFDFSEVYDLRAEDNIRGIDGYLKNWCVKMLFPFFFLYSYEKKKYWKSIVCVVLQLMLYLSFGEKTTLFSLLLVSGVYYAFRIKKIWVLFVGFCVAVFVPLLVYLGTGDYDFLAALSRRFCHIPSSLGYRYYEFFAQGKPFLWFSETIIGRIFGIRSPYPKTFAYYIANSHAMANTGVVADAYANGGLVVCILFAFILGVTLILYDSILKRKMHKAVIVGVLGYSCINLMDNGLLTSLLTNGMLLTLLVSMLLPDEENQDKDNQQVENRPPNQIRRF